jgi:hypothetical protein
MSPDHKLAEIAPMAMRRDKLLEDRQRKNAA